MTGIHRAKETRPVGLGGVSSRGTNEKLMANGFDNLLTLPPPPSRFDSRHLVVKLKVPTYGTSQAVLQPETTTPSDPRSRGPPWQPTRSPACVVVRYHRAQTTAKQRDPTREGVARTLSQRSVEPLPDSSQRERERETMDPLLIQDAS
ncbi:unnamed protein product [Arctogadus glacialis]